MPWLRLHQGEVVGSLASKQKARQSGGLSFLANLAEDWKCFEQPDTHLVDITGEEGNSGQYEQCSHGLLDAVQMIAKARQECRERLDRECRDDERNSETQRINRQQARTFRHGLL